MPARVAKLSPAGILNSLAWSPRRYFWEIVGNRAGQRLNWDRSNLKLIWSRAEVVSPERRKGWEL